MLAPVDRPRSIGVSNIILSHVTGQSGYPKSVYWSMARLIYVLMALISSEGSELRDGFRFRGGHIALDLPATLAARLKESPRELLETPRDLGRWLVAAGLANKIPAASQRDLAVARTLRESVYRLALLRSRKGPLPDQDRIELNRRASAGAAAPQLGQDGRMFLSGSVQSLLAGIAREAIQLLAGEFGDRIRQCESATCALLFLDTSRAGERRWCSMSACGNKAKVAEFRRRRR
jgi:predicted RNA-binding Zn ribbon-like protein